MGEDIVVHDLLIGSLGVGLRFPADFAPLLEALQRGERMEVQELIYDYAGDYEEESVTLILDELHRTGSLQIVE